MGAKVVRKRSLESDTYPRVCFCYLDGRFIGNIRRRAPVLNMGSESELNRKPWSLVHDFSPDYFRESRFLRLADLLTYLNQVHDVVFTIPQGMKNEL